MLATLAFYLFSAVTVGSALAVISARNPVHSVLFLILSFFSAAGLFVLLGAEFLAMILVIVYVGAVAVLFLFVVMMLDIDRQELRNRARRYLPVGLAVGAVMLAQLIYVVWLPAGALQAPVMAQTPLGEGVTNTAALGAVMYTRYAFLFQMCGMVLLVAMIGAITLTLRPRHKGISGKGTRQQDTNAQIERSRAAAVTIARPESGKGVQL